MERKTTEGNEQRRRGRPKESTEAKSKEMQSDGGEERKTTEGNEQRKRGRPKESTEAKSKEMQSDGGEERKTTEGNEQRKRGRPKGSTKAKSKKEMQSDGGAPSKRTPCPIIDKRNITTVKFDEKGSSANYTWADSIDSDRALTACRWGRLMISGDFLGQQLLYFSREEKQGNLLYVSACEVLDIRVTEALKHGKEQLTSYKTIHHPGKVTRIRELYPYNNIVATLSNSPEVLIWNVDAQPDDCEDSPPDLVLSGHKDDAEFALACFRLKPYVLSGGKDKCVVLWNIEDYVSTLSGKKDMSIGKAGLIRKPRENSTVRPREIFEGHNDTVEDVQFHPLSEKQFCSVGDDSCLLFWDARTGGSSVEKVKQFSDARLHCLAWNYHDENYILTGSADNKIYMFDRRHLTVGEVGIPVNTFEGHVGAVLGVQWSPDRDFFFGSCSEDGDVCIWDYRKMGEAQLQTHEMEKLSTPPGLVHKHTAHRSKVVDFHWNEIDTQIFASVSDDLLLKGDGGSLQVWSLRDHIFS